MADSTPQDPFEMFRRLWGPLGVPVPGMAMPTLDPAYLLRNPGDKKLVWEDIKQVMMRLGLDG